MNNFVSSLLSGAIAIAALPSTALAQWHRAETPHFVIYSEDSASRLQDFARELESFDRAYRAANSLAAPEVAEGNKLHVYIVKNTTEVHEVGGIEGNSGVRGYYRPRGSGSIAVMPRHLGDSRESTMSLEHVLFHEYAHHLQAENINGPMPGWLREGYAEFFSATEINVKKGTADLGRVPKYRNDELRYFSPPPIDALLADRVTSTSGVYAYGWVLTHYLTFEQQRVGQQDEYIRNVVRGMQPLEAAQAAFGDLRQLEKEMAGYSQSQRFPYLKVEFPKVEDKDITVTRVSPGFGAAMFDFIRSQSGVDEERAKDVVANLRRVAAQYPDDAMVHRALSEAEYDVDDFDAALRAAETALAIDPTMVDAHLYRAKAEMAIAERDEEKLSKDEYRARFDLAREHIGQARTLAPKDPHPMILFQESFIDEGRSMPEEAWETIVEAAKLAPWDKSLRFNAAQYHLSKGNSNEALKLLFPLSYDFHDDGAASAARRIIERIRRGDVRGAQEDSGDFVEEESENDETQSN